MAMAQGLTALNIPIELAENVINELNKSFWVILLFASSDAYQIFTVPNK